MLLVRLVTSSSIFVIMNNSDLISLLSVAAAAKGRSVGMNEDGIGTDSISTASIAWLLSQLTKMRFALRSVMFLWTGVV